MKIIEEPTGVLDFRSTMYPSVGNKVTDQEFHAIPYSTVYGFVVSGHTVLPNSKIAIVNEYFSISVKESEKFSVNGTTVFITRLGYQGQTLLGGPIENSGRLCYIDGCSDSLLVYPARMGDPSLNFLYFPPNIDQTFHIHPSIRIGVIANGKGTCSLASGIVELNAGDMFCLEERETHRFSTQDESMTVIAYHPDGDWGPTDHNHSMLNRTYITKKS